MTAKLRAAVIGLGAMGRHHVRVFSELPTVDLVAVTDVSPAAVERTVEQYGVAGYPDVDSLFENERPDVVSIVVPTSLHHSISIQAMERGANVLCEKPIASTIGEAEEMIHAAHTHGKRLMIGHIERFNPAILELKKRLDQAGDIFQIASRRLGPFPDRIRDVGVVVDLASHDIDAMNFLIDSPVLSVYAQTSQRIHTTNEDMVMSIMRFANGVVGGLDVNWLTSTKIRQLMVTGSRGTFIADYLTQDLAFYANAAVEENWSDWTDLQQIAVGTAVRYDFQKVEPLRTEIESFVRSIAHDSEIPASAEGATNALKIAHSILDSAAAGIPVNLFAFDDVSAKHEVQMEKSK